MNELNLVVTENITGKLSTNIEQLAEFVKERLADYTPEKYEGDAASAKKARSELNNAKKQIGQSRIALMSELMKPYQDFETKCKNLEKDIDKASKQLDEIVKAKENEEKENKKALINTMWIQKNFTLFPVDKVFNPQWLNKTYKFTDIAKELDAIITKTYDELKVIESYGDDSEILKAIYLETLDIGETVRKGEEFKKNRELINQEANDRADREHHTQLKAQLSEVQEEAEDLQKRQSKIDLVAAALEIDVPEEKPNCYTLVVNCTPSELLDVKKFIADRGVELHSCNVLEF